MHTDYFSRAIPEPFRILGLQLKPLSLGRYRLLNRHGVAFVSETEAKAETKDLIWGVLICSQRVEDFNAWMELSAAKRRKDLRKWGKTVCPHAWICALPFIGKWWLKRIPSLIEKAQLFRAYIELHSDMPKYWDESGNERASGSHWSQAVEVTLRAEVGWSKEEIDEEPLSKALADYFKYAETQGLIRIMTEAEIEQGDANAKVFEAMLKGAQN